MNTATAPKNILLVDDDKDMCESLRDVLTLDSDYKVRYNTSPLEALKTIEREFFDLIIIDYKMPEMNGIELLEHIKKIKPDTKVFMLTAFVSNNLIEEANKKGAVKILSKFIWPEEIIKEIQSVMG